jgi:hypothetical protein
MGTFHFISFCLTCSFRGTNEAGQQWCYCTVFFELRNVNITQYSVICVWRDKYFHLCTNKFWLIIASNLQHSNLFYFPIILVTTVILRCGWHPFDAVDGSSMLLRNIGIQIRDYTAPWLAGPHSANSPLWKPENLNSFSHLLLLWNVRGRSDASVWTLIKNMDSLSHKRFIMKGRNIELIFVWIILMPNGRVNLRNPELSSGVLSWW